MATYAINIDTADEIKHLQRWCNNKIIFKKCKKFEDYVPKRSEFRKKEAE